MNANENRNFLFWAGKFPLPFAHIFLMESGKFGKTLASLVTARRCSNFQRQISITIVDYTHSQTNQPRSTSLLSRMNAETVAINANPTMFRFLNCKTNNLQYFTGCWSFSEPSVGANVTLTFIAILGVKLMHSAPQHTAHYTHNAPRSSSDNPSLPPRKRSTPSDN